MTTRTRGENAIERRMPNVFERLSKQQTNRVNSQRTLKSISRDHRGNVKPASSSKKRIASKPKDSSSHSSHRSESRSVEKLKKSLSCDSYNEKALLEKVPETVGKDISESVGSHTISDNTQNNISSSQSAEISSIYERTEGIIDETPQLSLSRISNSPECLEQSVSAEEDNVTVNLSRCNSFEHKIGEETNITLKGNGHSPPLIIPTYDTNIIHSPCSTRKSSSNNSTLSLETGPQKPGCNPDNVRCKIETLPLSKKQMHDKLKNRSDVYPHSKEKDVIDDDKDICETDEDNGNEDFYNVKVQTRLVKYENSTLVIRNTSKQSDGISTSSSSSQCSDDSSQVVGENSVDVLHEPWSSSSLQNSSSSGDEIIVKTSTTQANAIDTRRVNGYVRSKFGQLMTRGRALLDDVKTYTNYVPDVKTFSSRLQNVVSNRSFRSFTSEELSLQAPPGNSVPGTLNSLNTPGESLTCFSDQQVASLSPETQEQLLSKRDQTSVMVDSGFSSLLSTPDQSVILGDNSKPQSRLITSTSNLQMEESLASPSSEGVQEEPLKPSDDPVEGTSQCQTTLDPSCEEPDTGATDFSKFFSPCVCQMVSTQDEADSPSAQETLCSCQMETEFPVDIKEILDVDHARMWWTITGNFGNILPIDWSKTYTRQKFLPVLNLNEAKKRSDGNSGNTDSVTPSPREDDDEEVAQDLDLHQLILAGAQQENEPVKSAEEVIKEIDDIMQEVSSSEDEGVDASSSDSKASSKLELQQLPLPLYHDKLKDLNVNELNETLMELEVVIRRYSETLIAQLAHRDELEYEKELKNTFISLLLQVQNKRRNFSVEKKKIKKPLGPNGIDSKYLTTVIPYDVGHGPPDNETIQILIKTINEDSPTVPTLLTDYILKVLCPS